MPKSIEELLNMASDGAEDSGDGDMLALLKGEKPKAEKTAPVKQEPVAPVEVPKVEIPVEIPKEVKPVKSEIKVPVENEFTYTPAAPKNDYSSQVQTSFKSLTKTPSLSIDLVEKIIRSFMYYSKLSDSQKETITRFVQAANKQDVPKILFDLIQLDDNKAYNLSKLVELYALSSVDRAWELISMENNILLGIAENAALFSEAYEPKSAITSQQEKIIFARSLEKAIGNIEVQTMENLVPVKELLSITKKN